MEVRNIGFENFSGDFKGVLVILESGRRFPI
jgi:hypothetical protein